MDLLESAMAFAVAMIIFSTIATGIVEFIVRFFSMREWVLRRTIESLFETVIWPRLKESLASGALHDVEEKVRKKLEAERDAFVQHMMGNPAHSQWMTSKFGWSFTKANKIDSLSTLAFAERLGRTEVGRAILAEGQAQIELLVTDFCRTFERFGRASSEVFRKRAKLVSVAVGVVLAFSANIDVGRLASALIENPDLRADLIANAEAAKAANDAAAANLRVAQELAAQGALDDETLATLREGVQSWRNQAEAAKAIGLPIGWRYYPGCVPAPEDDDPKTPPPKAAPGCAGFAETSTVDIIGKDLMAALRWAAMTLVAGVLIGLGGPFWYKAFSSLSQVMQLVRALGVGGRKADNAGETPKTPPPADASATPKDIQDAFRTAAAVHARETVGTSSARAVLGPRGEYL